MPTAVTLAAEDVTLGERLRERIAQPTFRIYVSDDLAGAEIGGAVKNVLAIACGVVEGHGLGQNARSALIARGFAGRSLPDGCAMFGGTFAAKGGIRPADRFEYELEDPVLKRTIRHAYDVITLPVRG